MRNIYQAFSALIVTAIGVHVCLAQPRAPLRIQKAAAPGTHGPPDFAKSVSDDPRRGLATLNDVPIIFDGKVEDQFGNAVAGATISASVRIYNGFKSTVERFAVTSDASGFFHIDHGKGEALGIAPRKDGYVLATPNTYFKYSYMFPDRYAPDSRNPTVIKMWKLQGAEPLASIDQRYEIPFAKEPIHFDLLQGRVVPHGGDLKIAVNRPDGDISERHPQDWSVAMEVVDGGFIKVPDKEWKVTYAAPVEGYLATGSFGKNNGVRSFDHTLFVKSRNGRVFSKLGFSFSINSTVDGLMYVRFSGVANTNGSRNWEATVPH